MGNGRDALGVISFLRLAPEKFGRFRLEHLVYCYRDRIATFFTMNDEMILAVFPGLCSEMRLLLGKIPEKGGYSACHSEFEVASLHDKPNMKSFAGSVDPLLLSCSHRPIFPSPATYAQATLIST